MTHLSISSGNLNYPGDDCSDEPRPAGATAADDAVSYNIITLKESEA